MKKYQRWTRFYQRMDSLGISEQDADALRRIELTLSRWGERECNGEIERDETTGKTYTTNAATFTGVGQYKRWPTPDRETGALARLAKIMDKYPKLVAYHQTDPRGCSLYIVKKSDIRTGESLDSVYTRGMSVCI